MYFQLLCDEIDETEEEEDLNKFGFQLQAIGIFGRQVINSAVLCTVQIFFYSFNIAQLSSFGRITKTRSSSNIGTLLGLVNSKLRDT